ncbi:MAG: hypothetical protein GX238_05525 [Epulopiscium sp.]|nr:hypothetical protein [Candidatus Epulonipiscium sp.]
MRMNKFTTGMMVGSIVGAASMMMMDTDKKSRRKMWKNGKKIIKKAGYVMDDIMAMYK